ncbi:hypothetical protein PV371_37880 [Streptomyces sp. TX20-6-3]|uniref:hypothetical protein n=1 Tax=Streptomyces sp. TX20-6-3 TaxID=3028705 RepID=UPI0029A7B5A3|nr:hypothetical protein [Streptomyces sp. TX20-6-3]MDX2565339.1 hypothetical protein [Streptomyces sp. TX20-6-3]
MNKKFARPLGTVIAAVALAPIFALSAAGSALAVDADGVSPGSSGSCTSFATTKGHGIATCQYTYSYVGHASGTNYADAMNTAQALVTAKADAETKHYSAVGFINSHLGGDESDGDGGVPSGAKDGPCNRVIITSSVNTWDYRTTPSKALSDSWNPETDSAKPYGAVTTEAWRVNCTTSW